MIGDWRVSMETMSRISEGRAIKVIPRKDEFREEPGGPWRRSDLFLQAHRVLRPGRLKENGETREAREKER